MLFHIDVVTTFIFTFEMVICIISYGLFINGKTSYLRSYWNILDFFIVIFSLAAFSNTRSLKIFKMFRVFRPLRLISRNEGLKTAVIALVKAFVPILSITMIVLLFFLIFGIIGISYFKGLYFYCKTNFLDFPQSFLIQNKWDCLSSGGIWLNSASNFDNIISAIATLF